MYYYISEPVTTSAERKRIEDLKTVLSQLGIAGEFAVASPARTVTEHLELAFKKGFTTIVAVGDDGLANTVASSMLRHNYDKAALGIIPFQSQQQLWKMVGGNSVKEFCSILRARHTTLIDVAELNDKQACITSASIAIAEPIQFQLAYDQVQLAGQFTDMFITTSGTTEFYDRTYSPAQRSTSFLARLFSSQPQTTANRSLTRFTADHWQLVTKQPVPIIIDDESATSTPLDVIIRKKALKLIVNRARIATEKEIDSSKE